MVVGRPHLRAPSQAYARSPLHVEFSWIDSALVDISCALEALRFNILLEIHTATEPTQTCPSSMFQTAFYFFPRCLASVIGPRTSRG